LARKRPSILRRAALPILAGAAYYYFLRPQLLRTGTMPDEADRELPGDEIIVSPGFQTTRAVQIAAPAERIWPWLAQIGRGGSGFYGLDLLSNGGQPSAAYQRADLPPPTAGVLLDDGTQILAAEANRLLLVGSFDLPTPLGQPLERTTLYLLEPQPMVGTRLIVRVRGYSYGLLGPLYNRLYELYDYINGSAQLENIRQRAELLAPAGG
jgi:hypothetical protein